LRHGVGNVTRGAGLGNVASMAATREPAKVAPGTVSFELERFELSGGRLELRGRWFGVRGVRFMRPTLSLRSETGASRALADLEHKPWIPGDGELWEAAFPCDDDLEVLDAELAVTSDIVIALPAPGQNQSDVGPIAVLPRSEPARAKPGTPPAKTAAARKGEARKPAEPAPATSRDAGPKARKTGRRESQGMPGEIAVLRAETERLRAEPVRLQDELDQSEQLRKDVEGELERLKLDADGAVARRDAAVDRFEDVAGERDAAVEARDAAVAERDRARAELQAATVARDQAAAARDRAVSERDQARAQLQKAVAERERAVAGHNRIAAERDAAISSRDKAGAEREQAIAERDRVRAQRMPSLSHRTVSAPVRSLPGHLKLHSDQTRLIQRAIAIAVLLVAGLALLIVVGVL
jgi:hypothetical protein